MANSQAAKPATQARLWMVADSLRLPDCLERFHTSEGWRILWAHGVCSDADMPIEHYPRDISVSAFRSQMEYLLSAGYRFISLTEGLQRMQRGQSLNRLVTLTFDDGFQNVIERAYPVMVELGLKGCLYVVAGCIGKNRPLWTDMIDVVCLHSGLNSVEFDFPEGRFSFPLRDEETALKSSREIKRRFRNMTESCRCEYFCQVEQAFDVLPSECTPTNFHFATWDQLRALDPNVLEIGNHTFSHPNLANVADTNALEREIQRSKTSIEAQLGREIRHFCYPAGSYNSNVISRVARAGHWSAVTIEYGANPPSQSPFALLRLGLPSTLAHFRARMSGLEAIVLRARQWVRAGSGREF